MAHSSEKEKNNNLATGAPFIMKSHGNVNRPIHLFLTQYAVLTIEA